MLTFPIDDSPLGQIIWRELHDNPVSAQNSNVIFAHLPRNMGCDDVIVVQFHPKRCVRQCLQDSAIHFNLIFFRQNIRLFPRPSSVIPGAIQPEPTCIKAYFKVHLCPKIGRTKLAMFVQLILRNRFISNLQVIRVYWLLGYRRLLRPIFQFVHVQSNVLLCGLTGRITIPLIELMAIHPNWHG